MSDELEECAGCAKVRRHPGEYTCARHPNFVVAQIKVPMECVETSMDIVLSGAVADAYLASSDRPGHVPLVNSTRTRIVGCTCGQFEPKTTDTDTEHAEHVAMMLAVESPGWLTDPNIDYPIFRAANHDLVTIFGELDTSNPKNVHTSGWRLWCMTCGLKGERLYQNIDQARGIAKALRSVTEPRCTRPR